VRLRQRLGGSQSAHSADDFVEIGHPVRIAVAWLSTARGPDAASSTSVNGADRKTRRRQAEREQLASGRVARGNCALDGAGDLDA
jgi:hypothetical protein